MEIETAPIINDTERESSKVWESPLKKPKTDDSGKSTEKETTTVNNVDEEQISDDDDGDWIDEETLQIMIEKLNKKYDDYEYIDDEKLRDAARAYDQRLNDNPFDIDDLPPPPIPDYFATIAPLKSSSWLWERAKELMHYAVATQQDKNGWKLSDLNLVKANKLQTHYFITFEAKHDLENSTYQTIVCDNVIPIPDSYGSIDVEIFKRKGEQAPAAVIGHN